MAPEDRNLVNNKYGKPLKYDQHFNGPKWRNRSCTDIPCLIIFLLFVGGWGFIAQYALRHGDLNKLMAPTDSLNQKCGLDSNVINKPYLFFFDLEKCIDPLVPITGCPTPQVCVESCPQETFIWEDIKNKKSLQELKSRLICVPDFNKQNIKDLTDAEAAINADRCASKYIKSAPFLNRCMWEISPKVCEFIPRLLLPRNRRDLINGTEYATIAKRYVSQSETRATADLQEKRMEQCKLGETVIKEKMQQIDTRLAKLIGNMVAHFYNGTHDAQRIGEEIVEDIVNSWYLILVALICTLVASLLLIALMRWLASPILWFSIFGVIIGLGVAIYYTTKQYLFYKNKGTVPNHAFNLQSTVKNIFEQSHTWLYLSIFLAVCLIIVLLLVIVLRKRISIAIALTKEGSKAVTCVISTVFFPIFSWLLFVIIITYTIAVGLYLGSMGQPAFRMIHQLNRDATENCVCEGRAINYTIGARCEPKIFEIDCYNAQAQRSPCLQTSCSFVEIEHPPIVNWFIVYNVFGFLWLSFFVAAFSDMVLAATFASWYWTFHKKDVPYFTLTRAFVQTTFYHLGTLAFGSLILAICRMIRLILEYIDSKLKKFDNAVTRAILCCMKCFFWMLETFLRFLNRNAYIMCAIHGKPFCASARDAFNLLMRNFLRVVALDKVTDFLFFLSKLLLTAGAGVGTYFYLMKHPNTVHLHYKEVPTVIVVIASFLITSVFFSVYSMAVDTLFLCFLEDCERNDGTPEKPYYMSRQLRRILGKKNKMPRRVDSNQNN